MTVHNKDDDRADEKAPMRRLNHSAKSIAYCHVSAETLYSDFLQHNINVFFGRLLFAYASSDKIYESVTEILMTVLFLH